MPEHFLHGITELRSVRQKKLVHEKNKRRKTLDVQVYVASRHVKNSCASFLHVYCQHQFSWYVRFSARAQKKLIYSPNSLHSQADRF